MDGSALHFIDSYHLLSYDTLDSTNEEAKRLAQAGGQHGAVVWAKTQTNGKGRAGKEWISNEGNLFFSVLLQPCVTLAQLSQLSFVTSLAVHRALQQLVEPVHRLSLKWPNDILIDGKKVGGILLETLPVSHNKAHWIIIGVGVNIIDYPLQTSYPATSLKDEGVEIVSAKIVLSRFLNTFEPLYDEWLDQGFDSIRKEWLCYAAFKNQEIHFICHTEKLTGIFDTIDENGHIIMTVEGFQKSYAAGEIRLEF